MWKYRPFYSTHLDLRCFYCYYNFHKNILFLLITCSRGVPSIFMHGGEAWALKVFERGFERQERRPMIEKMRQFWTKLALKCPKIIFFSHVSGKISRICLFSLIFFLLSSSFVNFLSPCVVYIVLYWNRIILFLCIISLLNENWTG